MTVAVQNLRDRAGVNGRQVADDAWLGGAAEPGADGTPAAPAPRRPEPAVKPYVPEPVKLLGGSRWPLILVEGGEYTGKSTIAFNLAASPLVGRTYVLAVGEEVDEFGAVAPDAMRLPHDGTWHQIMGCVDYVAEQARLAVEAGEPPVLFIIESMTKVWELLSEWAENRARSAPSNRAKLAADPNEEIDTHPVFWTPANKRHRRLVTALIKMSAIVVVTARASMKAEIGKGGNPTGRQVYKVEAQKELGFSTTAWVRVSLDQHPTIIGLRRVRGGIRPGVGDPVVVDPRTERFRGIEFSLEWLLTHVMQFDPMTARPAAVVEPVAGNEPDGELPAYARPVPPGADERPGAGPAAGDVQPTATGREG